MKVLALIMILFNSPIENQGVSILPTKLEIEVVNNLGNLVSEAEVTLFKTKEDYLAGTNEVVSQITNEKGVAKFKDLEPIPYFIDVRKGDKSNDGHGAQIEALEEGRKNKVKVVIH